MRNLIKKLIRIFLSALQPFCKVQPNKILFETFKGEVKDNVYIVYRYLKEHYPDEYECVWAIQKGNDVSLIEPDEIAYRKTFRYYYQLMTSRYWMRTHSIETIVKKSKKQSYIQLWHGSGAVKKEGFDILPGDHSGQVIPHAREWDYYIATDKASEAYIKTATGFQKKIYLLGSLRSDYLLQATPAYKKQLRVQAGIKDSETVILYAPTYRDSELHQDVVHLKIKTICEMENVRVILRVHPLSSEKLRMEEYGDKVIDGNKVAEINDLYLMSDILVTDYSSVAFDYINLNRPVIFYCYDLEEYNDDRGFYFDYLDHLGGPLVTSEEELKETILHIDEKMKEYAKQYQEYKEMYNSCNDGHVCERFVNLLRSGAFDAAD